MQSNTWEQFSKLDNFTQETIKREFPEIFPELWNNLDTSTIEVDNPIEDFRDTLNYYATLVFVMAVSSILAAGILYTVYHIFGI